MNECNCITVVNDDMKAKGRDCRIDYAIVMIGDTSKKMVARCQIVTERPSKKRKAPETVIATYCPFCGTKYPSGNAVEDAE